MPSVTLNISSAKIFIYSSSSWDTFQSIAVGYIPIASGSNVGGIMLRFDAIPGGNITITSAVLHIMTACFEGVGTADVNFRVSNAEDLYGDSAPSDPSVLGLTFSTTPTMREINLSYQVGTYATPESYTCLYLYKTGGGRATTDVIFSDSYPDEYFGAVSAPYIVVNYTTITPPTDSVLTLGTSGGNKQCDLYIGVGGVAKKVTDIYVGTASGNKRITSS
jgi:hypothetical protein